MPTRRSREGNCGETAGITTREHSGLSEEVLDCSYCGYVGTPGLLPGSSLTAEGGWEIEVSGTRWGRMGCPVCLDGVVDPWALIRAVRGILARWEPSGGS